MALPSKLSGLRNMNDMNDALHVTKDCHVDGTSAVADFGLDVA